MCEEFAIFLMQIDNQKWNDEKKTEHKIDWSYDFKRYF